LQEIYKAMSTSFNTAEAILLVLACSRRTWFYTARHQSCCAWGEPSFRRYLWCSKRM